MVTGAGGALLGRALEKLSPEEVAVPGVVDLLDWVHAVHDGDGHLAGGLVPAVGVALAVFSFFLALRGMRGLSAAHQAEADAARRKKTDGDNKDSAVVAGPTTRPLDHALHFITAFGFGWGLCMSGMTNAMKVRGFLDFSGPDGWDPSLMGVMAGAVGFNLISFRLLRNWEVKPVCLSASTCDSAALHKSGMNYGAVPANLDINWKLMLGATIFGVGWGMGGK